GRHFINRTLQCTERVVIISTIVPHGTTLGYAAYKGCCRKPLAGFKTTARVWDTVPPNALCGYFVANSTVFKVSTNG
ncbi:MAG: hypothetical protein LBD53_02025, partial [Tannerella sp.]|nr:hypothetical protein [Tannerella sp.]